MASSGLEKRAVVSCFIFRFPRGPTARPEVALFKRSDKVHTYRHHLAPIAGSIDLTDPSPLAAAWRELHEETTLSPTTLSLWRTGKPFTFRDASVGREWTVNPFAFRLHEGAERAIHTDWECESWGWHNPQTVLVAGAQNTLVGVPRLTDSLRRVWFEGETTGDAGATLAAGLDQLRTDHASGARQLTAIALGVFRDFVARTSPVDRTTWWATVRMAAWHLVKNGRESMGAATLSAVLAVLADIEAVLASRPQDDEMLARVLAAVDAQLAQRSSRSQRLQHSFREYLRATFAESVRARDPKALIVVTTSSSSTIRDGVLDAFAALDLQTLEVRVLESRPLFEGATLASGIAAQFETRFASSPEKTLRVRLYTDASAALAAEDVDVLLLGADQISATKGVSNKIGSLPLALCLQHVCPRAKVLVLSDVEKINAAGGVVRDDHAEHNSPLEVTRTWAHDGVKGAQELQALASERISVDVQNVYFEWVPLKLVDAFICEDGVLSDDDIRQKSQRLGELSDRYFGDL